MEGFIILNICLILSIVLILIVIRKVCKSERSRNIVLFILPLCTILCHYSSLLYHYIVNGTPMDFLKSNPNLILPIYPCNVVMWCALIYGLSRNKENKFNIFMSDYIFWFGIISSLVGMLVNVDFFKNPTLANYDVTKGIVAHAIMLLNVLALPVCGKLKIKLERNMLNILISIVMMFIIGCYCNLLCLTLSGETLANSVNSMFILHSPFEGIDFLTYPMIAGVAIVVYFLIFVICEFFKYKKNERWYNRIYRYFKKEA